MSIEHPLVFLINSSVFALHHIDEIVQVDGFGSVSSDSLQVVNTVASEMLMPEIGVGHEALLGGESPELKDLISEKKVFSEQTHHDSSQLEDILHRQFVHIQSESVDLNQGNRSTEFLLSQANALSDSIHNPEGQEDE